MNFYFAFIIWLHILYIDNETFTLKKIKQYTLSQMVRSICSLYLTKHRFKCLTLYVLFILYIKYNRVTAAPPRNDSFFFLGKVQSIVYC